MKFYLFICIFLCFNFSFGNNLPKSCYGHYEGEMKPYKILQKDIEIKVDSHLVQIIIHPNELYYNFGTLKLSGTYTSNKINYYTYSIQATITNNKSIYFKLDMILDTKNKLLIIKNHNQEPEAVLKQTYQISRKRLRLLLSS